MMDETTRKAVHATLARHKPEAVRAYDVTLDSAVRPRRASFDVPPRRRRFPAVLDWLDALDAQSAGGRGWERLELMLAGGEVRHYARPPAPEPVAAEVPLTASEVEVMPAPAHRCVHCGALPPEEPVQLAMRLTAQNLAWLREMTALVIERDMSGVREVLRSQAALVGQLGQSVRGLSAVYKERAEVAADAADARAEMAEASARAQVEAALAGAGAEGKEGMMGDMRQVLEMLPMLAQAAPLIRQAIGGLIPAGLLPGGGKP